MKKHLAELQSSLTAAPTVAAAPPLRDLFGAYRDRPATLPKASPGRADAQGPAPDLSPPRTGAQRRTPRRVAGGAGAAAAPKKNRPPP